MNGAASPRKLPPNGLGLIIKQFPSKAESIIAAQMENFAVPITRFGVMYRTGKRRHSMLRAICKVYCTCLGSCQLRAHGLIGVPHGSKRDTRETNYLAMTKNKRCDAEDGDKDYMYGIAENAGVSVRWTYEILDFLGTLGLMDHDGYQIAPNKDSHTIRISKRCIPGHVRTGLFDMCDVPSPWCDRYEKKNAKAIAKASREPVAARPPLFRPGIPQHITEAVTAKAQEILEAIKSTRERTPQERYDELRAFGRCLMPQGP